MAPILQKPIIGNAYKASTGEVLFITFVLQPAFSLVNNGQLAICVPPGTIPGSPEEAFVRLYLLRDKQKPIMLSHLGELKGQVKITSPQAALSFVRLFTSLKSHYLFDPPKIGSPIPLPADPQPRDINLSRVREGGKIEIIVRDHLDEGFLYGDKERARAYASVNWNGVQGIINRQNAMRYKLPSTTVSPARTGYRIKRLLAVEYFPDDRRKPSYIRLFAIQEWVGPDGTYIVEKATLSPIAPFTDLGIQFPSYL